MHLLAGMARRGGIIEHHGVLWLGGKRHFITLGSTAEGWTRNRAEQAAAITIAQAERGITPERAGLKAGRWDESYSLLRKCLTEFGAAAGEATCWDEAYGHFYELESILARQMKWADQNG